MFCYLNSGSLVLEDFRNIYISNILHKKTPSTEIPAAALCVFHLTSGTETHPFFNMIMNRDLV